MTDLLFMNPTAMKIGAALCRWMARVLGILLVAFVVLIAAGEGLPDVFTQPLGVQTGFLALAIWMAGIPVAWRWELGGGVVSLAGWFIFFMVAVHSPRGMNWFIAVMALPGLLHVTSAMLRQNKK